MIRTYSELMQFSSFEDRFRYLSLRGVVGQSTFGFDRYMNQMFYTSREWRLIRDDVIARDEACDLGSRGHEIHRRLTVHHMNPMTPGHIIHGDDSILDPEYLITTTLLTHNAIHYGDERLLTAKLIERRPGDTKLW